jgi:DNA gyrase/topoisomerase IV subunit A
MITDYSVTMVLTKQQYLKKTLKYSESQKIKDDDEVLQIIQTSNPKDLLLFTNKGRVFTRRIYDLTGTVECTPSALGEYIPNILKDNLLDDEKIIYIASPETYDKGYMLYIFENNNIIKMAMKPYENKQNRQVAQDAYNTKSELRYIKYIEKDIDILSLSSEGKILIQNTEGINPKTSNGGKKSQGNPFMKLDNNDLVAVIFEPKEEDIIKFKTEKKECVELNLSDICQNSKDKLSYYNHCKGKKNQQGNFVYNCRQKKDKIIEIIK